ncbi:MAG: DUF3316 domain-containing protein [Prevotellaceae bacterium]|nr:DUF3316 domain-containing protein [Prevotellaceae bacterium]
MPRARLLLLLLLLCRCQWGVAQRECSTLFGIGRANQYDTYLSPVEYRGPQVSMLHTTLRPLRKEPRVEFSTLTQLEYSYSHNPSGTTHEHGGAVRFDAGWSRRWRDVLPRLTLSAGGMAGADVGFLYNLRNSNNPAQARAGVRLSAAVGAAYELRLRQRSVHIGYNASLPLMGGMFSPQYGQSYYNIFSQGNYDHNVVLTHPGNSLSLRQRLTVSLTVRKRRVTVGYVSDLLQAEPHHLRQHQYSRSLLVGWGVEKGR